jgi:hypothetical protein
MKTASKPLMRLTRQTTEVISKSGAGEGIRTLDPNLGKVNT